MSSVIYPNKKRSCVLHGHTTRDYFVSDRKAEVNAELCIPTRTRIHTTEIFTVEKSKKGEKERERENHPFF